MKTNVIVLVFSFALIALSFFVDVTLQREDDSFEEEEGGLFPYSECVEKYEGNEETCVVFFGYSNGLGRTYNLRKGKSNLLGFSKPIEPQVFEVYYEKEHISEIDLESDFEGNTNPPEHFLTGSHRGAFKVYLDCKYVRFLYWKLESKTVYAAYPELNYCISDCFGTRFGSAVLDQCGVCDGDGSTCESKKLNKDKRDDDNDNNENEDEDDDNFNRSGVSSSSTTPQKGFVKGGYYFTDDDDYQTHLDHMKNNPSDCHHQHVSVSPSKVVKPSCDKDHKSPTSSISLSKTVSKSATPSKSASKSASPSKSAPKSVTPSKSAPNSVTPSKTPPNSVTPSISKTSTASISKSLPVAFTPTPSKTSVESQTLSSEVSLSVSKTGSVTPTPTLSETSSVSVSALASTSASASQTATTSVTASVSASLEGTESPSVAVISPSASLVPTPESESATPSLSGTASASAVPSATSTASASNTATPSQSLSGTITTSTSATASTSASNAASTCTATAALSVPSVSETPSVSVTPSTSASQNPETCTSTTTPPLPTESESQSPSPSTSKPVDECEAPTATASVTSSETTSPTQSASASTSKTPSVSLSPSSTRPNTESVSPYQCIPSLSQSESPLPSPDNDGQCPVEQPSESTTPTSSVSRSPPCASVSPSKSKTKAPSTLPSVSVTPKKSPWWRGHHHRHRNHHHPHEHGNHNSHDDDWKKRGGGWRRHSHHYDPRHRHDETCDHTPFEDNLRNHTENFSITTLEEENTSGFVRRDVYSFGDGQRQEQQPLNNFHTRGVSEKSFLFQFEGTRHANATIVISFDPYRSPNGIATRGSCDNWLGLDEEEETILSTSNYCPVLLSNNTLEERERRDYPISPYWFEIENPSNPNIAIYEAIFTLDELYSECQGYKGAPSKLFSKTVVDGVVTYEGRIYITWVKPKDCRSPDKGEIVVFSSSYELRFVVDTNGVANAVYQRSRLQMEAKWESASFKEDGNLEVTVETCVRERERDGDYSKVVLTKGKVHEGQTGQKMHLVRAEEPCMETASLKEEGKTRSRGFCCQRWKMITDRPLDFTHSETGVVEGIKPLHFVVEMDGRPRAPAIVDINLGLKRKNPSIRYSRSVESNLNLYRDRNFTEPYRYEQRRGGENNAPFDPSDPYGDRYRQRRDESIENKRNNNNHDDKNDDNDDDSSHPNGHLAYNSFIDGERVYLLLNTEEMGNDFVLKLERVRLCYARDIGKHLSDYDPQRPYNTGCETPHVDVGVEMVMDEFGYYRPPFYEYIEHRNPPTNNYSVGFSFLARPLGDTVSRLMVEVKWVYKSNNAQGSITSPSSTNNNSNNNDNGHEETLSFFFSSDVMGDAYFRQTGERRNGIMYVSCRPGTVYDHETNLCIQRAEVFLRWERIDPLVLLFSILVLILLLVIICCVCGCCSTCPILSSRKSKIDPPVVCKKKTGRSNTYCECNKCLSVQKELLQKKTQVNTASSGSFAVVGSTPARQATVVVDVESHEDRRTSMQRVNSIKQTLITLTAKLNGKGKQY